MRWYSGKHDRINRRIARGTAKREWHAWFAWHPVVAEDAPHDTGEWVWLEHIERRFLDGFYLNPWEYRSAHR